ncbi:MAG: acyl-CoA dehydrogenase family protein [Myxococcota bacterium]
MDLDLDARYETFRREIAEFLEAERKRVPRGRELGAPDRGLREWQRRLIERGYVARTIPREYGGFGAEPDLLETIILDEEFTRAGIPRGISGQGISMLVPTLLEHGSEEQKRRWIPPTLRGEILWCQGYSEPGAGSDLASLQTRAIEDGKDFVINGQKIWTSTAAEAQMMFVLVRTEPDAEKHAGISYLLLPMDTPGIEVRPLRTMTGGAEFNEVFFNDVRVPQANVVGRRGEGWRIANTTLRHERNMLGNAAQSERLLLQAVAQLREETCEGEPVLRDACLQDRLVELQAQALAMKYHSYRLLTHQLRGESPGVAGLVVKLQGCQLNHDIAKLAIDGMGEFGTLYHRSRHERRGGMWQFQFMFSLGLIIGGGTAQIQKNIIAERGLGLPREPRPMPAAPRASREG